MGRDRVGFLAPSILLAIGVALLCSAFAHAIAAPSIAAPWPLRRQTSVIVDRAADFGIDIVRIPPPAVTPPPSETPPTSRPTPPAPQRPQARHLTLPITLGSQSNAPQHGWLGVEMESLELPFAQSLGLDKPNGAVIVRTTSPGPAAQAGVRFGDIVVGINGTSIADMNDLRQRVEAMSPGSQVDLEVRRVGDDGDILRVLQRLADDGNAHIMYRLGRMYATGSGVARDDAEAVRWYRKGADAGNANAMSALGEALMDGRGTAVDQQQGLRMLKAAAAKEQIGAMYRMAHILLEGKLEAKDPLEAARLLTKGAESGHTPSMVELGRMYVTGIGVQADPTRAVALFKQAAERNFSPAMVNLGWAYEHGTGIAADASKAAMWYKHAVDLGNSVGMVDLGVLYAQGRGVEKNETTAVALYRRAVSLGNPMGLNNLAWMLQGGKGVNRNPEEAADLMMQSLDKHNDFSRQVITKYANAWSREFREALQRRLRDAGFYSGRIDGQFRASTIDALNAYFNRAH
jgi:TPR repeat protein